MIKYIALVFAFLFVSSNSYSQCSCCTAAFSGSALAFGTSNVGVLKEKSFRIIGVYRYLYGSRFYDGTHELKKYSNEELNMHFTGINLGYGVTKELTLESEIGSFPNKDLNMGYLRDQIAGMSSLSLISKYTVLSDKRNAQEITFGFGGRMPLTKNEFLSGNAGLIMQLFYFINPIENINFVLLERSEIYFKNSDDKTQGGSHILSLFTSRRIVDNLAGILETRFDYLTKSHIGGKELINTGRSIISVVPQLNYNFDKFSISGFAEIPIYKNYNGVQLSEKIGSGIALIYMF